MSNAAQAAAPAAADVLSMQHITKIYGNGFMANKDICFSVRKGEIHGLVGENGLRYKLKNLSSISLR